MTIISDVSSEDKMKYLIEEMKVARQRIDAEITTMNNFEIFCATAIGAIYVLFFQYKVTNTGALIVLTFLPVLICLYGIFRYRAHAEVIKIHEKYIKFKIEKEIFGEENKYYGMTRHYDLKKFSILKYARLTFWVVIFLISFAIFVIAVVSPAVLVSVNAVPR